MNASSSMAPATWPSLELRHLLALVAVAETGTFSAAAEQLGYTQPAVSQKISTIRRMPRTPACRSSAPVAAAQYGSRQPGRCS